jgi:Cupin
VPGGRPPITFKIGSTPLDGLSSVLREVKVRSVVYCLSDFAAPWGFSVERSPVAKFHVLLHGAAALAVPQQTPRTRPEFAAVHNDQF